MTDKIYLHGINANEKGIYDSYSTIKKVGKILRSRYLLTLKQQRQIFSYGFNGVDYISLCDYEKRDIAKRENHSYNGFKAYAESSVAFAFPKDQITVIEPIILDEICVDSKEGYKKMAMLGVDKDNRYSDYPDEVQHKGSLAISKSCGITFPTLALSGRKRNIDRDVDNIMYELELINQLIEYYEYNLGIYDVHTLEELNSSSAVRMVLKNK